MPPAAVDLTSLDALATQINLGLEYEFIKLDAERSRDEDIGNAAATAATFDADDIVLHAITGQLSVKPGGKRHEP